jgi:DNA repair exonuclease SbcCD ATPase subunit
MDDEDKKDLEEEDVTSEDEEEVKDPKDLENALAEMAKMRTALRKANREAAERRKKLQALEEAEVKTTNAEQTKLEKAEQLIKVLETRAAKLQEDNDKALIRMAVEREAVKQNVLPEAIEDVSRLIDTSDVEITEDGKIDGVEDAVKALVKRKPYLVGKPGKKSPDIDSSKTGDVAGLTPEEIITKKRADLGYSL